MSKRFGPPSALALASPYRHPASVKRKIGKHPMWDFQLRLAPDLEPTTTSCPDTGKRRRKRLALYRLS